MRGPRIFGIGLLFVGTTLLFAETALAEETPPQRARPPKWSKEVRDTFFFDARKQLVGTRPRKAQASSNAPETMPPSEGLSWSSQIDADTLTTEIKRVASQLSKSVAKPGLFNSGGYQDCRRDFALLALLMRVVEEFDQQVRWQRDAGSMRRQLEYAAVLCEEANEQSWAVAKQTQNLLADLIRGQSPQVETERENQPVDRAQLMLRMERSNKEILGPSLANKKMFRRHSEAVAHESQVLAVLAKVIVEQPYDYSEEEEFIAFARQLGEASNAMARAAKEKDYDQARSAAGRITQSCSHCHEDYRG